MKNESLWGVDNKFTICMQSIKSLLKQTTPLQICSAPFLNSQEARKIQILVDCYAQQFKSFREINSVMIYHATLTTVARSLPLPQLGIYCSCLPAGSFNYTSFLLDVLYHPVFLTTSLAFFRSLCGKLMVISLSRQL